MKLEFLAAVGREVLGWPGVETERARFFGGDVAISKVGRRQLGHVHHDGVADLLFPKAIHDELIAAGRATPTGPASRPSSAPPWSVRMMTRIWSASSGSATTGRSPRRRGGAGGTSAERAVDPRTPR